VSGWRMRSGGFIPMRHPGPISVGDVGLPLRMD
jgi:hypothetical protein